jgi:hypothetical protein
MRMNDRRSLIKLIAYALPATVTTRIFAQKVDPSSDKYKSAGEPFMLGFLRGNDFRTLSRVEKIAYVTGVWDGYMFAPALGGKSISDQVLFDCIPGLVQDQLLAIVEKYMNEHPEVWGQSMNWIVYSALPKSCRIGIG